MGRKIWITITIERENGKVHRRVEEITFWWTRKYKEITKVEARKKRRRRLLEITTLTIATRLYNLQKQRQMSPNVYNNRKGRTTKPTNRIAIRIIIIESITLENTLYIRTIGNKSVTITNLQHTTQPTPTRPQPTDNLWQLATHHARDNI